MTTHDLEGKNFTFDLYDPCCVKRNVLKLKHNLPSIQDYRNIVFLGNKIMGFFNIYYIYFYADRTCMAWINEECINNMKYLYVCN